jgi:peroxiredoxin Q/BCP
MNRKFRSTLFPLCFALSLAAAEPPSIGQKAPDFELKSLSGATVKLSAVTAKGPTVLVVLRGFPGYQCPYCNRQVQDMVRNAQAFADAGAHVLLVYPGSPAERATEFASDKRLPDHFDLLLDPDYRFTNLYNLRWDAPQETAYPATFVLNRTGVIGFATISKSHAGRATSAEILEHLKKSSK